MVKEKEKVKEKTKEKEGDPLRIETTISQSTMIIFVIFFLVYFMFS